MQLDSVNFGSILIKFSTRPKPKAIKNLLIKLLTHQWIRYHAHTKPHFALSVALGVAGPVLLLLSPVREKYLYANHEPIPYVYPLPTRERDATLTGYDD